jgi:hypothetical protein
MEDKTYELLEKIYFDFIEQFKEVKVSIKNLEESLSGVNNGTTNIKIDMEAIFNYKAQQENEIQSSIYNIENEIKIIYLLQEEYSKIHRGYKELVAKRGTYNWLHLKEKHNLETDISEKKVLLSEKENEFIKRYGYEINSAHMLINKKKAEINELNKRRYELQNYYKKIFVNEKKPIEKQDESFTRTRNRFDDREIEYTRER